jgi:hypothetical protein
VWAIAVAALLAPIGFLASFFLWTADRPQDGYEQVLFDVPNLLTSLALVGVLVGAGWGGGVLLRPHPIDPNDVPYFEQRAELTTLAKQYQKDKDAYAAGDLPKSPTDVFAEHKEHAQTIVLKVKTLHDAAPERFEPLLKAANALAEVTSQMDACAAAGDKSCDGARFAMADYQGAARLM